MFKWAAVAMAIGVAGWATSNAIVEVVVWSLGPAAAINFSGYHKEITPLLIFLATIFAPLTESLAVWGLVWLAQSKLNIGRAGTSLASSAAMVILHGSSWASLAVLPTFAMHAAIMFSARLRQRSEAGYILIFTAHCFQNSLSIIRPLLLT
jgi:hypothetical protein